MTQNDASWPINGVSTYKVAEVYATIQGEGRLVGTPMTIVRLQGCPVACHFCDQPETWNPSEGSWRFSDDITRQVEALSPRWALITGGEPAWHDLWRLTHDLRDAGLKTALETSGVFPVTGVWNWICLSPKPLGALPLMPSQWIRCADEIKWIVGREQDVVGLEEFLALAADRYSLRSGVAISVQPISCLPKPTKICLDALVRHPDWFLSVQVHKYVNIA